MSPISIIKKFFNQLPPRNHQSNIISNFQSNEATEIQSYLYFLIIICFFFAFYYRFFCYHYHGYGDVIYNNFFQDIQDLFLYLFDANKIILRIVKKIINKTLKLLVLLLLLTDIIYLPLDTSFLKEFLLQSLYKLCILKIIIDFVFKNVS